MIKQVEVDKNRSARDEYNELLVLQNPSLFQFGGFFFAFSRLLTYLLLLIQQFFYFWPNKQKTTS
jgi:hypothetical protein